MRAGVPGGLDRVVACKSRGRGARGRRGGGGGGGRGARRKDKERQSLPPRADRGQPD